MERRRILASNTHLWRAASLRCSLVAEATRPFLLLLYCFRFACLYRCITPAVASLVVRIIARIASLARFRGPSPTPPTVVLLRPGVKPNENGFSISSFSWRLLLLRTHSQ